VPQALPREQPDFDLRLIEPAPMRRRVVNCKSVPDLRAKLHAEQIGERLAAVDIEIVQHQVDGRCRHVLQGDFSGHFGEFEGRTIRCREGEMTACLGLYGAENIGRPVSLILVIPPRFLSRYCRRGRPQIGVQGDRLLVSADHWLFGIIRPLIQFQNIFHLGDVLVIEIGHYPHFFPATASDRGLAGVSGWFPFPHAEPVYV
jgi:hypothetical protein